MSVVTHREECSPFITKDGSSIRELMAWRNSACAGLSLAEATLPAGGRTECHVHPVAEEIYYFLSGSGKVLTGDAWFDAKPGASILHKPGVRHQTWNTGTGPLVFLCVCAPAYEHDDTVILPDSREEREAGPC